MPRLYLAGPWVEVPKLADTSRANTTTLSDDPALSFPVKIGGLYVWEAWLVYASPAGAGTPDFKFTWVGPTGSIGIFTADMVYTTADALSPMSGAALGTAIAVGTAASKRLVISRGWMAGATADGAAVLRWAQNTASSSATILYSGSLVRYQYQRIA